MFRAFVHSAIAFLAGTIAVYLMVAIGTLVVWEITGYRDLDGGAAMTVAFIFAPSIALPAGLAAAVYRWRKARRAATGRTIANGPA
ncbi:MAG: hypothetical protein ACK4MV_16720 [Beijerinckiaceae bacterium]